MKRMINGIKDFFYDMSVKIAPKNKKTQSFGVAKREALIFYICLLALPILQICIFYVGINVNTIKLAFEKKCFFGANRIFQ
jgi:hypothetical protein